MKNIHQIHNIFYKHFCVINELLCFTTTQKIIYVNINNLNILLTKYYIILHCTLYFLYLLIKQINKLLIVELL